MSYNKQYNTRNSGRYNTGQFVSAGERWMDGKCSSVSDILMAEWSLRGQPAHGEANKLHGQQQQYHQFSNNSTLKQLPQEPTLPDLPAPDVEMKTETKNTDASSSIDGESKPAWMKPKLAGVRKVTMKERRRRQNENLRRLLTPKNALMVLNEMTAVDNLSQNFLVEQAAPPPNSYGYGYNAGKPTFNFCADLTVDGDNFKGYGENKMMARNAAAEQAIRNIFLKKMNKLISEEGGELAEEEPLPMIQLASFALQKLFTEWEYEGHKVPQLKPPAQTAEAGGAAAAGEEAGAGGGAAGRTAGAAGRTAGAAGRTAGAAGRTAGAAGRTAGAAGRTVLPSNAASLHPCSLLAYMRPGLVYQQLAVEGATPQNISYTMGIELEGAMYIGKGHNKKEARKQAAKSACEKIFKIVFDAVPTSNTPVPPTS